MRKPSPIRQSAQKSLDSFLTYSQSNLSVQRSAIKIEEEDTVEFRENSPDLQRVSHVSFQSSSVCQSISFQHGTLKEINTLNQTVKSSLES